MMTKKLVPGDLVSRKPDEAFVWRQAMPQCAYDHVTQQRRWEDSEVVMGILMSTGAPTSSTAFDGEKEE